MDADELEWLHVPEGRYPQTDQAPLPTPTEVEPSECSEANAAGECAEMAAGLNGGRSAARLAGECNGGAGDPARELEYGNAGNSG